MAASPILAESSYHYLATSDITQVTEHVTIADVYDVDAINFINQVLHVYADQWRICMID